MRELTLHEKISIKGLLKKHVACHIAPLTMENAVYLFPRMFGRSVADWIRFAPPKRSTRLHPSLLWGKHKQRRK